MTFGFPCKIHEAYRFLLVVPLECMCVLDVNYYYVKNVNVDQTLKFIRMLFCATHTHNIIVFKCHNTGFRLNGICCGL